MEIFISLYLIILVVGIIFTAIGYTCGDMKLLTALAILGALVLSPITILIAALFVLIISVISIPVFFYKFVLLFMRLRKSFKKYVNKIVSELKKEIEEIM